MLDPTQYLRMRQLFGADPSSATVAPSNPWNNVSFSTQQSTSVPQTNPNIFGSTPPQMNPGGGPIARPDIQDANPEYDPASRVAQLYHPETMASSKYSEMASQYPKQEDYHPTLLRRLGGALISMSSGIDPHGRGMGFYHPNLEGMQAGNNFVQQPYEKKLEDWKAQLGPAYQSAQLERYSNVNARSSVMSVISDELKNRAQNEKAANDQAKSDISANRAQAYSMKAMGYDFDFKGPFVTITHPTTGQITTTNIPTGHMSDTDKLVLGHKEKMAEIGARDSSKGTPFDIPDPDDPTGKRKIPVMVSPTGQATRITLGTGAGRKPVNAPIQKPGVEQPANTGNLQAIQDSARETMNAINNMVDDADPKNPQLRENVKGAIGASRMLGLQHVPGSETYTADVNIKNLKSNLLLNLMQKMKSETKGGTTGFGRITNADLAVMNQAASRLDSGTDRETFRKELLRVREKVQMILDNPGGNTGQADVVPGSTASDLIKQYSDPNYKAPKKKS